MADLTFDDLVNIHLELQERFPNMARGIQKPGLLDSITKRPNQKYYDHIPFPDIYSKCASLMEAIIRWHTFFDGNKRTGLAAASAYMYKNNCRLVMPLSAVRFSVLIADKNMNVPFEQIVDWIKLHTAHNNQEYNDKYNIYILQPANELLELARSDEPAKREISLRTLNEWLAIDIYPEYEMEWRETMDFLMDLVEKYHSTDDFNFSR